MKHSTDRILTTHAGRLDGRDWQEMARSGDAGDAAALQSRMVKVIREQAGAGIDVVSDGELGKVGFGLPYYGRRLAGLTSRTVNPDDPGWMSLRTGERIEFADFYKTLNWPTPTERVVCTGPVSYIGNEEVKKDTALFKASLSEAAVKVEEAFMCVLAPGWLEHFFHNEHYRNDEEFLFALADAMKHEYKAIVDAGFVLQIDDPALPDTYDMIVPTPSIEEDPEDRSRPHRGAQPRVGGTPGGSHPLSHLLGELARASHPRFAARARRRSHAQGQSRRLFSGGSQSPARTRVEDLEESEVAGKQDPDPGRRQPCDKCRRTSRGRGQSYWPVCKPRRPRTCRRWYRLRAGNARPPTDRPGEAESTGRWSRVGNQGPLAFVIRPSLGYAFALLRIRSLMVS